MKNSGVVWEFKCPECEGNLVMIVNTPAYCEVCGWTETDETLDGEEGGNDRD